MTKKNEFSEFSWEEANLIKAIYGIKQLQEYSKRKVKELREEIKNQIEEEEIDYEKKYIEAYKKSAIYKILADYREIQYNDERYLAIFLSFIVLIETVVIICFLI